MAISTPADPSLDDCSGANVLCLASLQRGTGQGMDANVFAEVTRSITLAHFRPVLAGGFARAVHGVVEFKL